MKSISIILNPLRYRSRVAAIPLLLALAACELEVEPLQQVPDDQAITDAGSAQAAILGVYNQAQSYYTLNYPVLGYLPADNVIFNGTLNQFNQIDQVAFTPDNPIITDAWSSAYRVINGANNVLAAVPGVSDLTDAQRSQFRGEAYFLRALAYFDLGRAWGGVPIKLTPTRGSAEGVGLQRATLAQTYAQVQTDIDSAIALLPEAASRNRAVKNAARALNARLALYKREWAQAEAFATQVITNSSYALVAPYRAFSTAPFLSQESIFELSYSNANPNNQWNNWYPSSLGGQYTLRPSAGLITLANDVTIGGGRSSLLASTTSGGQTFIYGNLYNRSAQRDDPAYVLRIAEQYLIRAEARAQLNNLTGAAADLNAVRARAGLLPTTAATQDELLLAIENERRLEFAFEAHRWFDLVRTERADDVLGVTDTRRWLYPIPLAEVAASGLRQNPGY